MTATSATPRVDLLVWIAAAIFLASWFLPVLPEVPGWMAFRYALAPLVPYGDAGNLAWDDNVPQVLSALTNVMFVILVVLWMARQMFRPGLFLRIALACVLLNLSWLVRAWREHGLQDLLFGYYVWMLSFVLMLVAGGVTAFAARRTWRTPTDGTPP
jgi:hypothetical protein